MLTPLRLVATGVGRALLGLTSFGASLVVFIFAWRGA